MNQSDDRYLRNYPALNREEQKLLMSKRVMIAGCGGQGGYLLELLLRLGVGAIVAVDPDRFASDNLNRQLLSQVELLGTSKTDAVRARAAQVNPDVRVETYAVRLDEQSTPMLLPGCDLVFDALDSTKSRKMLAAACAKAHIPMVHGATTGWTAQAAVTMPGDHLIDQIYPEETDHIDNSVLSFTPALCASIQAALGTQLLVGRRVKTGTLFTIDLQRMKTESIHP